jgi:hypothetical protein
LQNPNWWEFRHPSFIRGKPQLLSDIKRSMHFVAENGSNGKEISELKSQVANLTEQLNALNDTVEKLTGAFHTMNVHQSAPSSSSSMINTKNESSRKKRKASSASAPLDVLLPASSPALMEGIELKRMSSLSSTTYVEDLKSSGISVPTSSEFENFAWNDEEVEDGEGSLFEEMCESLIDLEEEQEDPNTRSNSMVEEDEQEDVITPFKSEYPPQPVITHDLSDLSDTLSDVSSVIDKLPSDLQLRFVDKLAEVVGSQLASVMTISKDMPIVKAELIPDHHSSHFQQSGSFHYPEYILPCGNKAPEIALPLASAAISAFLLKTFSHHGLVVPSSASLTHLGDRVGAK